MVLGLIDTEGSILTKCITSDSRMVTGELRTPEETDLMEIVLPDSMLRKLSTT